MNAAQERQLLDDAREARDASIRIEQHLIELNSDTAKNTTAREKQPRTCEQHREKLSTALHRNRIAIVVVALGGGTAGGIITKLAGLW